MNESGSRRARAMSRLMTPSVARAGVMISASAAISSSLLSGLAVIFLRRMSIAPPVGRDVSSDEVGLVDDAVGLAGADADEDAFVQPVEPGRGGLDLGRGAEGVLGRVHPLAARGTALAFRARVTDAARFDVDPVLPVWP